MKGANGITWFLGNVEQLDKAVRWHCGRKGCWRLDHTSFAKSVMPAASCSHCSGKAGFSVFTFYKIIHCLQNQNYKKGLKKSRMEGRAVKSGTRCTGIPAAMNASFLHCIHFDDEQIPKGIVNLFDFQNSTWNLVRPLRCGICLFPDAFEVTICCRKSPLWSSGSAVTTSSSTQHFRIMTTMKGSRTSCSLCFGHRSPYSLFQDVFSF